MTARNKAGPGPLLLVAATVALQLAAAWVLDSAADHRQTLLIALLAVAFAIGLNLLRFVVWRHAHQRFPLSHTYPLTALFFPFVLALAWFTGDAVNAQQLVGTALITLGVLAMASPRREGDTEHA